VFNPCVGLARALQLALAFNVTKIYLKCTDFTLQICVLAIARLALWDALALEALVRLLPPLEVLASDAAELVLVPRRLGTDLLMPVLTPVPTRVRATPFLAERRQAEAAASPLLL
jgi:hypothetical protein